MDGKITGLEVIALDVGTYFVRYKGTSTHNASDSVTVTITLAMMPRFRFGAREQLNRCVS